MGKYDIILAAEETFAREVALGVIVSKPLSAWHYLIPGIFVIDFLRRGSAIRNYIKHFMFPRKQTIDAAQDITNGEVKSSRLSRVEEEIKDWLNSLNLYSQKLHWSQMAVINLLVDHYAKLLDGEGDNYHSLIRNAYKNRENYDAYLSRLASAEIEVDRAITEKLGAIQNLQERLIAEEQEVAKRRKKSVDEVFLR